MLRRRLLGNRSRSDIVALEDEWGTRNACAAKTSEKFDGTRQSGQPGTHQRKNFTLGLSLRSRRHDTSSAISPSAAVFRITQRFQPFRLFGISANSALDSILPGVLTSANGISAQYSNATPYGYSNRTSYSDMRLMVFSLNESKSFTINSIETLTTSKVRIRMLCFISSVSIFLSSSPTRAFDRNWGPSN